MQLKDMPNESRDASFLEKYVLLPAVAIGIPVSALAIAATYALADESLRLDTRMRPYVSQLEQELGLFQTPSPYTSTEGDKTLDSQPSTKY